MPEDELQSNKRPQEKLKDRGGILLTGPGESARQASRRHKGRSRMRARQELGCMPMLVSMDRVVYNCQAKTGFTPKKQCFGKFQKSLIQYVNMGKALQYWGD